MEERIVNYQAERYADKDEVGVDPRQMLLFISNKLRRSCGLHVSMLTRFLPHRLGGTGGKLILSLSPLICMLEAHKDKTRTLFDRLKHLIHL